MAKDPNQLVAQYSFSFAVRSPTCFGQIYWSTSSGSHTQHCFNLGLSHVVTTVVVFTIITVIKSGCNYNTVDI